jgi:hypothetical protein
MRRDPAGTADRLLVFLRALDVHLDRRGEVVSTMNEPDEDGWFTCEVCGLRGPDVELRENPYAADIHGVSQMEMLCDSCTQAAADDI